MLRNRWTQFDVDNANNRIKQRGREVINTLGPELKNKYRNKKVVSCGINFDSKKESNRYWELKILERAGEITELELQKRFDLVINGVNIGFYKADFYYKDVSRNTYVIEDVKSKYTRTLPVYRLKKKLIKAIYNLEILET